MNALKLELPVAPDLRVSALATQAPEVQACYVLAHGAGAGMEHPFMTQVAEGLAQRRIATLRYQFPSMESGKRRPDSPAVAHATVRAAVALAASHFGPLPLFAGGKSFGGRMTSQAQALEPMEGVSGLIFLGFPLHPPGKPSITRAAHLADIDVPMLFVHGTRDKLAEPTPFQSAISSRLPLATVIEVAEADHSFHVPMRSGRRDSEVLDDLLDSLAAWTQALRP
jgi:predicted alpha/beta-hydrolase family hydrolase